MDSKKVKSVLRIIGYIIGIGIFSKFIYDLVEELASSSYTIEINWYFVILSMLIIIAVYFFQIINYHFLLRYLGVAIHLKTTLIGYALSFLPKYIPGHLWGYLSRTDWYQTNAKISPNKSILASGLELIITVATSLAIWAIHEIGVSNKMALHYQIAVFFLPMILVFPVNLLGRLKFKGKAIFEIERINVSQWLVVVANSYFQWILFGIALKLLILSLNNDIILPETTLSKSIYAFARSWVSGFLAILIPNGLGVREVVLKKQLLTMGLLDGAKAALASTASRLTMLLAELTWIIPTIILKTRFVDKNKPKGLLQ